MQQIVHPHRVHRRNQLLSPKILVIFALVFLVPYQAPADNSGLSTFCNSVKNQAIKLSSSTALQNWPKNVKYPQLSWPIWTKTDPEIKLDLIRRGIYWTRSRAFYGSAWTDSQYNEYWGSQKQQEIQWEKQDKEYIDSQIKSGNFSMELANIHAETEGKQVNLALMRFKLLSNNPTTRNPLDNWQYIIESASTFPNVQNVPISASLVALAGEMGVLENKLVLFNTLAFPVIEVERIDVLPKNQGWPQDPDWNEYKMIQTSALCVTIVR